MISALCRTTALSVTVLPMVLEVTRLFGGFFLAPSRLPKYFVWLDALSYIKYSFVGAALNELDGLKLSCDDVRTTVFNATYSFNNTCITTGQFSIKDKGYDNLSIGACIGALFGFIIFCRGVAFLGVRFLKN